MLRKPTIVAVLCGLMALCVGLIAVAAVLQPGGWRLSELVRMTPGDGISKIALAVDPSFDLVPPGSHTDGTYYYAIALDPFGRGEPHTLVDEAAYHYGHPGYGWLAGILSRGNAIFLPQSLLALDLVGIVAAAIAVSLVASRLGWSPWAGLLVAFSPGLISCVIQDLAEPIALAFAAIAVLSWLRGRLLPAAVLFVAAALCKEEFALVPAGFAIWHAIEWLRGRPPDRPFERALCLVAGPLAVAGWYSYVRVAFGISPNAACTGCYGLPFVGWIDTFHRAGSFVTAEFGLMQVGTFMVPVLAILAVALAVGSVRALRFRSPLDAIFLLFVVLASFLNWLTLLFPKDLARDLLMLLLLLPAVYSSRVPAVTRTQPAPGDVARSPALAGAGERIRS
jgi:hypothetical protein